MVPDYVIPVIGDITKRNSSAGQLKSDDFRQSVFISSPVTPSKNCSQSNTPRVPVWSSE